MSRGNIEKSEFFQEFPWTLLTFFSHCRCNTKRSMFLVATWMTSQLPLYLIWWSITRRQMSWIYRKIRISPIEGGCRPLTWLSGVRHCRLWRHVEFRSAKSVRRIWAKLYSGRVCTPSSWNIVEWLGGLSRPFVMHYEKWMYLKSCGLPITTLIVSMHIISAVYLK